MSLLLTWSKIGLSKSQTCCLMVQKRMAKTATRFPSCTVSQSWCIRLWAAQHSRPQAKANKSNYYVWQKPTILLNQGRHCVLIGNETRRYHSSVSKHEFHKWRRYTDTWSSFLRVSGYDKSGRFIEAPIMAYATNSTSRFYPSKQAIRQLGIIGPDFPALHASQAKKYWVLLQVVDVSSSPNHFHGQISCHLQQFQRMFSKRNKTKYTMDPGVYFWMRSSK